jgi:hypothetical protein
MRRLAPLVLLLAACTGTAEDTTTTAPLAELSTTTTTMAPSTTTTTTTSVESGGPVDICPRGIVWEAGAAYHAPCFLVPISFSPSADGWVSAGARSNWVMTRWSNPDRSVIVGLGIIAFRESEIPEDVLASIGDIDGITALGEPRTTTVAGFPGLVVDVRGSPSDNPAQEEFGGCVSIFPVRFTSDAGNPILGRSLYDQNQIGVGYCHLARIWAIDTGGPTITLIGGTTSADPVLHAEAVEVIERLLETVEFLDP